MKRTVSLPALVAQATTDLAVSPAFGPDDPRSIRAPFFTAGFLLSLFLWPVGALMGAIYLFHARWRAAGAAMLALALVAGVVSSLVYWSLR
jgi:hypothetical protein